MSRRRHPKRPAPTPTTSAPPVAPPVPLGTLVQRLLLGSFTALLVARPLIAGDDPGRLRLTTSGAELTYLLLVLLLVLGVAVRRVLLARQVATTFEWLPLLFAGVGVLCYISGHQGDRYARPALYFGWEWFAIAGLFYLARRLGHSAEDTRSLVNVVLASAISVAAVGVYQSLTPTLNLPSTELPNPRTDLVGDDEFYGGLNRYPISSGPHGTYDRPETWAVASLLLVPCGIIVAVVAWTRGGAWRCAVLLPLLLLAGVVLGAWHTAWHLDGLQTSWALWQEQPWWGVGPGNFARRAPDHSPFAGGAWPELLATTGIFALVVLLVASVILLRELGRPVVTDSHPAQGPRWDCYYGSIVGLLVGFVLASSTLPPEASSDELFRQGTLAIGRAVVWFACFGLLERVRPSLGMLRRGLLLGLALVVMMGFVSTAVLLPTVLSSVVVLAALALNLHEPRRLISRGWAQPLAVASAGNVAVVVALYLFSAAVPGWSTATAVRDARLASMFYFDKDREINLATRSTEKANALTTARNFLRGTITNPLREALRQDRDNTALMLEIARWQRPLYRYQTHADPKSAAELARDNLKLGDAASKLDPHNLAGQRSLYESLVMFQKEAGVKVKPKERLEAINERIRRIAEREPQTEVALRYRMVNALFDGGDLIGVEAEISRLFRLANAEGSPHGMLTAEQRTELVNRAIKTLSTVPPEVLEEWVK